MHNRVIGLFIFAEQTVTTITYCDMLENFMVPQVEDLQPTVIFQQDGAPPRWSLTVKEFLDKMFHDRWIGHDGPILWPPQSLDITPLDFLLWGFVRQSVLHSYSRHCQS
jgi:hypothetical protein